MDREDWDARYAASELLWGGTPNAFVAEEVERLAPGRALDLACGEGRNAIWLATLGWSVVAVDFSEVAIERGRRLAAERGVDVDWQVEDVLTWTPPAPDRDLVLLAYLQLPEEQMAQVLRHAAGALAPSGVLLDVAHDRSNLDGGHGGPQDPALLRVPTEVAAVCAAEGLTVERAEVVRRAVETATGVVDAFDHVVRARRAA